jgi:hypothetical protein
LWASENKLLVSSAWVQILAVPLSSYECWVTYFSLSGPQFCHLENEDNENVDSSEK